MVDLIFTIHLLVKHYLPSLLYIARGAEDGGNPLSRYGVYEIESELDYMYWTDIAASRQCKERCLLAFGCCACATTKSTQASTNESLDCLPRACCIFVEVAFWLLLCPTNPAQSIPHVPPTNNAFLHRRPPLRCYCRMLCVRASEPNSGSCAQDFSLHG